VAATRAVCKHALLHCCQLGVVMQAVVVTHGNTLMVELRRVQMLPRREFADGYPGAANLQGARPYHMERLQLGRHCCSLPGAAQQHRVSRAPAGGSEPLRQTATHSTRGSTLGLVKPLAPAQPTKRSAAFLCRVCSPHQSLHIQRSRLIQRKLRVANCQPSRGSSETAWRLSCRCVQCGACRSF
jgi:hypothetical protein